MKMGLLPRNSSTRALARASRARSTGVVTNRLNAHRSSTPHLLHVNQLLLHAGRPSFGQVAGERADPGQERADLGADLLVYNRYGA